MTSIKQDLINTIWVDGYHGTSHSRAQRILAEGFRPSMNGYDWLGTGVYFWQDAPNHALHWARKIYPQEPVVIKSRLRLDATWIDLLDMSDIDNPDFWLDSYNRFTEMCHGAGQSLPTQNPDIPGKRYLDCAFFDYVKTSVFKTDPRGAIRSAFVEGKQIFPNSAIFDRTHVQIAIVNLDLIESSCIYEN
jgi:hypothetical protein